MTKIKLVSGKEVDSNDILYWVDKKDLSIINNVDYEINLSYNILKENECVSEVFATNQEAKSWRKEYKIKILQEKHKKAPIISKEEAEKIFPNLNEKIKQINYDVVEIQPTYYKGKSGQDVLDVIEDFELDFYLGNICKYVVRAGKKTNESALKDLVKAKEYLDRKINSLQK